MGSRVSLPEEDLSCPVCYDIFTDPIALSCGHNFCKACLEEHRGEGQERECPVCGRRSSEDNPALSLALKTLCEDFSQQRRRGASVGSEALCSLHDQKLGLFCLDDRQPVCVVCRDSGEHDNHRFTPIDEAALDHKEDLRTALETLQEKVTVFSSIKQQCCLTAACVKVQAQHSERLIKEEFKRLHQFLQEEEEARIAALREEGEQKIQMMREKFKGLSRDMSTLSDTIRAIEEELRAEDVSLPQNYKAAVKRAWRTPNPRLVSGALIDVAKHLGNLTFRVWEKMQEMVSYAPVILDPNTANAHLILSEDLTSVRFGTAALKIPDNPERFGSWARVLGSQSLNTGKHSWDVEVGSNSNWELGVAAESAQKKGHAKDRYWRIRFYRDEYKAISSQEPYVVFPVRRNPRRVRVQLDWDRGKLSFWDPDTDVHLHTITCTFNERLFPYIGNADPRHPMTILPVKVCVAVL